MLSKTKLYRRQHSKCSCFFNEHLIKCLPSNRKKYNHLTLAIWSFSLWPLKPSTTLGERWLPVVTTDNPGDGQACILATTEKACLWLCYSYLLFSSAPQLYFWLALRYRSTKELMYLSWNSSSTCWNMGFWWVHIPVCSGGLRYLFLDLI